MAEINASPQQFLWVNKNIHSSALSNNKDDATQIRSVNKHVQQWRAKSFGKIKSAQAMQASRAIGCRRDSFPKDAKTARKNPPGPGMKSTFDPEAQAMSALSTILARIPPRCGSPVDPFESSSVLMTNEVFGLMRHFIQMFLPTAILAQVENVLNPEKPRLFDHIASTRIIQDCVADQKHMYSMLAVTSHQIKYAFGHKLARTDSPEYYMAKALERLRPTMEETEIHANSQQIILDFNFLAMAEAYRTNLAGALVHQRIILYIAQKLGGFNNVEPFVREMCRMADIFISSINRTSPILGLADDPGPIAEDFFTQIQKYISPQRLMGISFLQQVNLWDSVMFGTVHDVLDVVQAAQFLWAFPGSNIDSAAGDWVLQRSHTLTYKLLSMVPTCAIATIREAIQECCRLCFILWLFYVLAGTSGSSSESGSLKRVRTIMPEHARQLQKSIELADSLGSRHTAFWGLHGELLIWVLAFGTLSCKDDDSWFASELRAEAKMRGMFTYDSLATISLRYLSLDRLEQLSNRKLARTLIAGAMEG
jgi:hypothetical protein